MLNVDSREYKVMLAQGMFTDREAAAGAFCRELLALAGRLKGVSWSGEFEKIKRRQIVFLDTTDATIRLNGFVFRQRTNLKSGACEYTLKCRSADRYVAAGADLRVGAGYKAKPKLEEDVGAPFVSRFSHSATVEGPAEAPAMLGEAAEMFRALAELERDGELCPGDLKLTRVGGLQATERVFTGPMVTLGDADAEAAIILWSDGPKGRPLVAEFSFRYQGLEEAEQAHKAARRAMEIFYEVQRLDWCRPQGRTKTAYAYREE